MTGLTSALYFGEVVHQRVKPRRHRLAYRVFAMLIDLDELDGLHDRLRLFSHNRFNLFSFYDRDHGRGRAEPLRPWLESHLQRAGVDIRDGAIRILCYPRILGYVFNPLTVYFCYGRDGTSAAILYEVNNTFGQRHTYLIPVTAPDRGVVRQACSKRFYVSPFNDIEGGYRFRVALPDEAIAVVINQHDDAGPLLHASFKGRRAALSDRALAAAFVRYPLMTVKVIAGIHWEALRLWRKGLGIVRRPPPPLEPVTVVAPGPRPSPPAARTPSSTRVADGRGESADHLGLLSKGV